MAAHERVGAPQRLTGVRCLREQDVCPLFHGCGHYPPRFLAARLLHGVRHIYVTATVFAS